MTRRLRDTEAGIFHVHTHCVWAAERLYRDDNDRMVFLRDLARAVAKAQWTCIAVCLMNSHYHLILAVDTDALPLGMHSLNFRYAVEFNTKYRMKGHVLATRYKSKRIVDNDHLLTVYRYVVRNPVKARLCERPEEWPWSSYASAIGIAPPHSFVDPTVVLSCFDGPLDLARAKLREFVEEV
jgi:putative transposase